MTIEKLNAVRNIAVEINNLEERRIRLLSSAMKMTSSIREVTSTTNVSLNTMQKYIEAAEEISENLSIRIAELEMLRKECDDWLVTIEPYEWRKVIECRYFEGKEWEEIARDASVGYSIQNLYKINSIILKRVE